MPHRRLLTALCAILPHAVVPALAQTDESTALDAVSIQGRPGFMESYELIVTGEEDRGIAGMLEVLGSHGSDPDCYILEYNLACAHARRGRIPEALDWLGRAVTSGYGVQVRQVQNLDRDPDLGPLRETEEFREVLEVARERSARIQSEWAEMRAPVILGARGDKPQPALLLFHPFGVDPAGFAEHFRGFAEAQDMVVIAPCGTRLLAPDRWAFAVSSEDLIDRFRMDHREAVKALSKARESFSIDEGRIYTCGLGQGAALAYAFAVRNPQVIRGAVLFNGGYGPSTTEDWLETCTGLGRRIQWYHGRDNAQFPLAPLVGFAGEVQKAGLQARLTVLDGGHGLPADLGERMQTALEWIDGRAERDDRP